MNHRVRRIFSDTKTKMLCVAVAAVVITGLAILVTPLRYSALPPIPMKEVAPATLYKDMQSNPGKYLFVDVRGLAEYQSLHAQGSVSIPVPDVFSEKSALAQSGKTIVVMCGDGRSAAVVYGYLQQQGFTDILHLQGGFNSWRAQNLPTESARP
jgi:phage shock protein E